MIQDLLTNTSWKKLLEGEFSKDYFVELCLFLNERKKDGAVIFPKDENIFNCLNTTDLENTKVVILGQDPYHGENQAHGLSFSVESGKFPPSLRNIYKELNTDLDLEIPETGNLIKWAQQGVLLLNAVLTVEQANANAHENKGWEQFTDKVISEVSNTQENVVFILWGSYAQKKAKLIDKTKHLIIKSPHPSPLSSYRGFFGSKPFSQANDYLIGNNKAPINWKL